MTTLQDYISQVQTLIHDTNSANFTAATLTGFINQARTRVALDTHCCRLFLSVTGGSALNTIAEQENYYYSGTVGGMTVTEPGLNYTNPTVAFTGGGGTGAAATAVVIGGQIAGINMTDWGQGYGSAPGVAISDPTGTGAAASATALTNILDILSITVLWGDERIIFEWCPFTMFQTFMRQYINQYNVPSVFTMHQATGQIFLFQIPDQAYTMEWDIITIPPPLVGLNTADPNITAPYDDAVQFYAAHLAIASLQNYAMADYWYSGDMRRPGKYDLRIKQLYATIQSRRIYNPYRTFIKRLRRM